MFNFFGTILHTLATFVVGALITTGLATVPTINPPLTQPVAVSASTTITASTTEMTSTTIQNPPYSPPPQPKTHAVIVPASTQNSTPSTPTATIAAPASAPTNSSAAPASVATPPVPQPITITIEPDTLGIVSAGLEAFYNVSSNSDSEVDLKTLEVSVSGVQTTDGMVVSITDDTDNQLLMATSQSAIYNSNTHTLNITATLNRPLRIYSGYPTMFDIKATNLSPMIDTPTITIVSVGSDYILNSGGSVLLKNTLDADTETAAVNYYLINHTCAGLQSSEYSDCLNYSYNH